MVLQLVTGDRHEVGTEEQRAEEEHGVCTTQTRWCDLFCAKLTSVSTSTGIRVDMLVSLKQSIRHKALVSVGN